MCVCVCVCVYICTCVYTGVLHKVCQTVGCFMTKNSKQEKQCCSKTGGDETVRKAADSV